MTESDFEEDWLVIGVAETKIDYIDRVYAEAVGDVEVVGDGEDGFRTVGYVEVAQGSGRGVPGYAACAPEEGCVKGHGGKMRIGCLGRARYVLGRILVPVAADDERSAM